MPTITINGVNYELPENDGVASKVPSYNEALIALAAAFSTGAAWSSWTPTWTNLTLGNGVVVARYQRVGKLIIARLSIILGSTSSVAGLITFSLPVTRVGYAGTAGLIVIGHARLRDDSVPANYNGAVLTPSTTTGAVAVYNTSGTYAGMDNTHTVVPFAWATTDEIAAEFSYEGA